MTRLRDISVLPSPAVAKAGLCLWLCLTLSHSPALSQPAQSGGSPLDTIMNTKIWADVPEAKDFVRDSRPPADSLSYQPLNGVDPERPKPRSKAELQALQGELEQAGLHNQARAGQKPAVKKPAAKAPHPVGQP